MKVTGISTVALSQNCKLAPGHSKSLIKYLRATHMSLEKEQYSVGVKVVAGPPEEAPRGDRRAGGHEEGGCEGTEKNAHVASVTPSFSVLVHLVSVFSFPFIVSFFSPQQPFHSFTKF